MANEELLHEYSRSIIRLKKRCMDEGMSEDDFRQLYHESLDYLENSHITGSIAIATRRSSTAKFGRALVGLFLVLCIGYNIKSIYSTLVCNLQDYIYPGLRLLRRISIPFISLFPRLTELYHETCLIQNPFFTIVDMDCWPCSSVSNVREIFDLKLIESQPHTAPFIYETGQQVINIKELKELYWRNEDIFNRESPNILVNNKYYFKPSEIFQNKKMLEEKNLYIWKFNTMNSARILRQAIPRPKVVPKFGQSTERFIIIDSKQEQFHVPDTECTFSFLLMLSGSRTVDLKPAEECKLQCKTLRVELRESYLLWYNWWYWRPVVQPSIANQTLIAHVGSYC